MLRSGRCRRRRDGRTMLMAGADGRQSAPLTSRPSSSWCRKRPRARALKNLISQAPKAPGKLNHGSAGNGSASHLATVLRNWRRRSITAHRSLAPSSRPHTLGGRTSSPLPPTSSASNDLSAPASIGRPPIAAHNNKIAVVLISCVTARTLNAAYHTVKLPPSIDAVQSWMLRMHGFCLGIRGVS